MESDLFIFEKLDVYRLALEFAKAIHSVTKNVYGKFFWTDQINRAALSIVLNIAEGSGRKNPKEKKNFYNIAKGSVFECVPLIELGAFTISLSDTQRSELRNTCTSIAKMLTKLTQSVEKGC